MKIIIEIIVGVMCVIGYLWVGIYIGRTFCTFEKFVLAVLDKLNEKMGGKI